MLKKTLLSILMAGSLFSSNASDLTSSDFSKYFEYAVLYNDVKDLSVSELEKKYNAHVYENEKYDLRMMLFEKNGEQYSISRGTVSLENWYLNLKVGMVPDDGLWHRGFHDGSNLLLTMSINDFNKSKPVHLIGHSLGGALSVNLAKKLHNLGFEINEVVTYGQPKTTDSQGRDIYQSKLPLTRIVNFKDLVTYVPPRIPFYKYKHLGDAVILLEDNQYAYLDLDDRHQYHAFNKAADDMLKKNGIYEKGADVGHMISEWIHHGIQIYERKLSKLKSNPRRTSLTNALKKLRSLVKRANAPEFE